jgi:RNA ligase
LRECRGIIFNTATGKVIARRLHKFFNVNEREETQVQHIDFSEPHVILEKLDGSMITPLRTTHGIRWGTKMGVTMVALPVEEFIAEHEVYSTFASWAESEGYTPIFEWCSRKQTIVIDYEVDQLVLTAMRNNVTGEYMSHVQMVEELEGIDIPVVKAYAGTAESMQALIEQTGPMVGCEGFVVRFETGHMLKVKAEDYVRKHKAKDMIGREKNIVELLVTEKMDDVKAFLDEKDLARVEEFEINFWKGVNATAHKLVELRCSVAMDMDRKTYAVDFVQKQDPHYSRFLYAMHNLQPGDNTFAMVKDAIAKSCSTQAKIDDVRWMFGCDWNAEVVEE